MKTIINVRRHIITALLKIFAVILVISVLIALAYHVIFINISITKQLPTQFFVTVITCIALFSSCFLAILAFFSLYSRCPNCKKCWCVKPESSIVLNRYQYNEGLFLIEVTEMLEEKYCRNCQYIRRSKRNEITRTLIHRKQSS